MKEKPHKQKIVVNSTPKGKKADHEIENTHRIWWKFSNWLVKKFGKDLHGEWEFIEGTGPDGKKCKIKYRSFNDLELSRRLVGYEAMCKVEKFVKRYCPEVKIVKCDDSEYSGSDIILIPHPSHGITVIFIPQCTSIQNHFFLYKSHHRELVKALTEMGSVYDENT